MDPIVQLKKKSRRTSFVPQPLHIPAIEPLVERGNDDSLDEGKTGSYVVVIDIS